MKSANRVWYCWKKVQGNIFLFIRCFSDILFDWNSRSVVLFDTFHAKRTQNMQTFSRGHGNTKTSLQSKWLQVTPEYVSPPKIYSLALSFICDNRKNNMKLDLKLWLMNVDSFFTNVWQFYLANVLSIIPVIPEIIF